MDHLPEVTNPRITEWNNKYQELVHLKLFQDFFNDMKR